MLERAGEGGMGYDPLLRFQAATPDGHERRKDSPPVLYCIHGGSGFATFYKPLAEQLAGVARVVGVQARGLEPGERPFSTYSEMIDAYHAAIMAEPTEPVVVLGWSLGGYIAHDLAGRLASSGRAVDGAIILDSREGPIPIARSDPADFESWLQDFDLTDRIENEALVAPAQSGAKLWSSLAKMAAASGYIGAGDLTDDPAVIRQIARVWHQNVRLLDHRPRSSYFAGPALVVRASDTRDEVADPSLGWAAACDDVEAIDMPFGHFDLMRPAAMAAVADAVRNWLPTVVNRNDAEVAGFATLVDAERTSVA
jgi:thioesterase domain-containing protein